MKTTLVLLCLSYIALTAFKNSEPLKQSLTMQCTSSTGSDCSMLFDAQQNSLTCDCSGSSMLLETNDDEIGDFSVISSYMDYFKKHIDNKYQRTTISVKSLDYKLYETKAIVSIKYISPEDGGIESVMYVTNLEDKK